MTDEDMRTYNERVDRLCGQGWKRLDAEREVFAAWISEKRHKETVSVTRPEGLGSGRKIEPVFDQDER